VVARRPFIGQSNITLRVTADGRYPFPEDKGFSPINAFANNESWHGISLLKKDEAGTKTSATSLQGIVSTPPTEG
jgi:hypothetical protein